MVASSSAAYWATERMVASKTFQMVPLTLVLYALLIHAVKPSIPIVIVLKCGGNGDVLKAAVCLVL